MGPVWILTWLVTIILLTLSIRSTYAQGWLRREIFLLIYPSIQLAASKDFQSSRPVWTSSVCQVRVSPHRHKRCTNHTPCVTRTGFNPSFCPVCTSWLSLIRPQPITHSVLSALQYLRQAWTRARKVFAQKGITLFFISPDTCRL